MCEIFAVTARRPTQVSDYLHLLGARGGRTGPHADGWGIAWLNGRAAEIHKQAEPAAESRHYSLLAHAPRATSLLVAHIRKANPPDIGRDWANTHPFEREVGGATWVFAHNGKLPGIEIDSRFTPVRFLPVGDTDSERAFCHLLDRLADVLPKAPGRISSSRLARALAEPVAALASLGEFNFVLSDGYHLVAHATGRLHMLEHRCRTGDCHDAAVYIATEPITTEGWIPIPPRRIHVFATGRQVEPAPATSQEECP